MGSFRYFLHGGQARRALRSAATRVASACAVVLAFTLLAFGASCASGEADEWLATTEQAKQAAEQGEIRPAGESSSSAAEHSADAQDDVVSGEAPHAEADSAESAAGDALSADSAIAQGASTAEGVPAADEGALAAEGESPVDDSPSSISRSGAKAELPSEPPSEPKSAASAAPGQASASSARSKSSSAAAGGKSSSAAASEAPEPAVSESVTGSDEQTSDVPAPESEPAADPELEAPSEPASITVEVEIDASNAAAVNSKFKSSLGTFTVELASGATVYDALVATGVTFTERGGNYIDSIGGIAEKACGAGSGWMYSVDGAFPGKSAMKYRLSGGEKIRWAYTVNLGDV